MNHILHRVWFRLAALCCLFCALPQIAAAQDETPIIQFKSVAKEVASASSITLFIGGFNTTTDYIDVDCGNGMEERELLPATINTETGSWEGGAYITCTLDGDGTVKIYGDASNIAVMDFSGCYISELEMAQMPNLYYLNLEHNELGALDLDGQTSLQYLTLTDNAFDKQPLKVGNDKPNLMVLEIGQVGQLDPSFSLRDYPALVSFDAYACKSLTQVDPTGCPNLQRLSLDGTGVSSLDVSANPTLTILNISDTNISEIDLKNLQWLQQLYVDRQGTQTKIKSLDVTANKNLVYLFAAGNDLKSIDLTQNTYLQQLYLADNLLSEIDLSQNVNLINVILRGNCFTFATLPAPGEWTQYDYSQRNMPIAKTVKVGDVLDFSDKVLREGTTTTFAVFAASEDSAGYVEQLPESYYTYENGKVTFLQAPEDSVYLAFANDLFPDILLNYMPLRTDKFKVKTAEDYGKDDLALSVRSLLASSAGVHLTMKVGMEGATPENPKKFYICDIEGNRTEFEATTEGTPETCNVDITMRQNLAYLYVPQDELVTALAVENQTLLDVDLKTARSLRELKLAGTELYSIDLGYNKNLRKLELTGNHFFTLNIRGVNDAYQKTMLQNVNLSNNELREVTLNDMGTIHHLNLSNNELTELSLKDADNMETLDLSNNKLTTVNLSYCTLMTDCNIANNRVSELAMPEENSLVRFHCENNDLNFSTLPLLEGLETYTFAPQNLVQIAAMAPSVDLQAHNVDGQTAYVWKNAEGDVLTPGSDYEITDGRTRFLDPVIGQKVYCEMTNPRFDGLTLTTTQIEAAAMPQYKLASFTTLADGEATMVLRATRPTTICIDWKGGAHSVESYTVDDNLVTTPIQTYAGAECAVYAYSADAPLYVFSVKDAKMENVDLSNMKQLVLANVSGAGIDAIKLPETDTLAELILKDNNFSQLDLSRYAGQLRLLTLNNNKFTEFDATPFKSVFSLNLANNLLESVQLDNPEMWNLDLSGNQLQNVDLSKVPELNQLFLTNNQLSSLDLSAQQGLHALHIDKNRFTFSTLPLPSSQYGSYQYGDQANLDIEVDENGCVDLSGEALVGETPTTYRWFVDAPWYDEDTGELTGEELYINEEYTLDGGITKFLRPISNVVCALLNEKFPNLTLYTNPVNVTTVDAIRGVQVADGVKFSLEGRRLHVEAEAGQQLSVYNAGGQQVGAVQLNSRTATLDLTQPGVYVVRCGEKATKVVVK